MNNEFYNINEEAIEITAEEQETVEETVESRPETEQAVPEDDAPDFTVTKHSTKKKRRWHKIVALSLVCGIVAGTAFGVANNLSTTLMLSRIPIRNTEVTLSHSESGYSQDSKISKIAQDCMPSIVAITNRGESDVLTFFGTYTQESTSSGSGIIIGKNDTELLIVTNYHVVANSKELSVVFSPVEEQLEIKGENESVNIENNKLIPKAVVKGYNSDKDLAVIAVSLSDIPAEVFSEIRIATIGDSSALKPGDNVVAIGNALGYGQSVTTGIISAVNRKITMESSTGTSLVTNSFIQTDAAINPGNSGGALLNMAGELIGINSVKIASSGVEGMGYAIPITDVSSIIDELMIKETRNIVDEDKQGFLGISGQDVTASVSQSFGIPEGVFVASVMENLAADNAGIKKGNIITEIDGYAVKSVSQLQERLTYYKKGETIKVKIQVQTEGGYKEKIVEVKLSSRAENIDK